MVIAIFHLFHLFQLAVWQLNRWFFGSFPQKNYVIFYCFQYSAKIFSLVLHHLEHSKPCLIGCATLWQPWRIGSLRLRSEAIMVGKVKLTQGKPSPWGDCRTALIYLDGSDNLSLCKWIKMISGMLVLIGTCRSEGKFSLDEKSIIRGLKRLPTDSFSKWMSSTP